MASELSFHLGSQMFYISRMLLGAFNASTQQHWQGHVFEFRWMVITLKAEGTLPWGEAAIIKITAY